ncbi:hypothetical protein DL96DRAFT_1677437, partial [Flagelloscypha sp. PMI_526]
MLFPSLLPFPALVGFHFLSTLTIQTSSRPLYYSATVGRANVTSMISVFVKCASSQENNQLGTYLFLKWPPIYGRLGATDLLLPVPIIFTRHVGLPKLSVLLEKSPNGNVYRWIHILPGTAVITTAQNPGYILEGRFILGFGIIISTTTASTWVLWLQRKIFEYLGMTSSLALANHPSVYHYDQRLVLLRDVGAIITLGLTGYGSFLVAEVEEARNILIEYHSNNENTEPMIELQLKECQEVIQSHKMEPVAKIKHFHHHFCTCLYKPGNERGNTTRHPAIGSKYNFREWNHTHRHTLAYAAKRVHGISIQISLFRFLRLIQISRGLASGIITNLFENL